MTNIEIRTGEFTQNKDHFQNKIEIKDQTWIKIWIEDRNGNWIKIMDQNLDQKLDQNLDQNSDSDSIQTWGNNDNVKMRFDNHDN